MSFVISNNLNSLYIQNALAQSQTNVSSAMKQLSTGMRINSAADDAAGLAIATNINAQTNGDGVAIQNANNANSLAQIADGALASITNDLQTLNNLAVESANGTNSSSNRAALQTQAQALVADIQNTAKTTNYNGVNLLSGNFNSSFQIGASAGNTVSLAVSSVQSNALGAGQGDGVSAQGTGAALASGDLVINGVAVSASQSTSDTASTTNAADSAIAKVAAINAISAQTNVVATTEATVAQGTTMSSTGSVSSTVSINGVSVTLSAVSGSTSATRSAEVAAINAVSGQTGVVAADTGSDTTGVSLTANDGRNIAIGSTAAWTGISGGGSSSSTPIVSYGGFTLSSTNNSNITIAEGTTTGLADSGLQAGTYTANTAAVSSSAVASVGASSTTSALTSGDLVINGVSIGATNSTMDSLSKYQAAGSSIAVATAINQVSSQSGVTATVNANVVQGTAISSTAGHSANLYINGVSTATITATGTANTDAVNIASAVNKISGQTGVSASLNSAGTGINFTAADGRNITLESAGTFASADMGFTSSQVAVSAGYAATAAETNFGTYTLSSGSAIKISSSTLNGQTNGGLAEGSYGGTSVGQLLSSLDISTVSGANTAISAIQNALNQVNNVRTNLGAFENRMTATVSNLQSTQTNLITAYTNITGADYAAQTAALSRAQVIQQAGIAVLSQANAQSQQVLTLLR